MGGHFENSGWVSIICCAHACGLRAEAGKAREHFKFKDDEFNGGAKEGCRCGQSWAEADSTA